MLAVFLLHMHDGTVSISCCGNLLISDAAELFSSRDVKRKATQIAVASQSSCDFLRNSESQLAVSHSSFLTFCSCGMLRAAQHAAKGVKNCSFQRDKSNARSHSFIHSVCTVIVTITVDEKIKNYIRGIVL